MFEHSVSIIIIVENYIHTLIIYSRICASKYHVFLFGRSKSVYSRRTSALLTRRSPHGLELTYSTIRRRVAPSVSLSPRPARPGTARSSEPHPY